MPAKIRRSGGGLRGKFNKWEDGSGFEGRRLFRVDNAGEIVSG